jgi:hypothetical protein
MKIPHVTAELFHADGQIHGRSVGRTDRQTDRHDEAHSRFSKILERV